MSNNKINYAVKVYKFTKLTDPEIDERYLKDINEELKILSILKKNSFSEYVNKFIGVYSELKALDLTIYIVLEYADCNLS